MITLHHLRISRSSRIIWLLEELGLEYDLKCYDRTPEFRAPPELKAVHPLGKAPTVEVDGRVMVESGAIIEYLVERHGGGKLAVPDDQRSAYLEWLHFAEGSLAMPIILNSLEPMFGGYNDRLKGFVGGEVTKQLGYMEDHMTGRDWLLGETFTGADVNMGYLMEHMQAARLLETCPALKAYRDRLVARPAYQKMLEIGGPLRP
ncbi:glutathione S-transferase family protein [Novosphingopyxis sp.]|uniref:glutathione S-transferase family protein n=1 Tax=Novosphingopyxis sp. TaxID=2709690 RepID=UPI003B58E388